jgi:hypothetical protein
MKLADEEGRLSKESHRELNIRDKDAGDLFGIRAIEAGYFGGVAQSANNSPVLTPRGSLGELSPTFSGPQYSRAGWAASSSVLDLNKYGRSPTGDNYDNHPTSPRHNHPRIPSSPSSPHTVRKSPSPTKSPPISPAFSPITAPMMAHVRQLALRPSTAERTGRHSHSPPIEPPIDLRFEVPSAPLDHPEASSPPPVLNSIGGGSNDKLPAAKNSAPSQMVTLRDDDGETPHLSLPDFIGSSAFVASDFDRPKTARSSLGKLSISARRKSMNRQPSAASIPIPYEPVLPAHAVNDASSSMFNDFKQENTPKPFPSRATHSTTSPLLTESGRDYFDHSRTYPDTILGSSIQFRLLRSHIQLNTLNSTPTSINF